MTRDWRSDDSYRQAAQEAWLEGYDVAMDENARELRAEREGIELSGAFQAGYDGASREITTDPGRFTAILKEPSYVAQDEPPSWNDRLAEQVQVGRHAAASEFEDYTRVRVGGELDHGGLQTKADLDNVVRDALRATYPEASEASLATFEHDTDGRSVWASGHVYERTDDMPRDERFREQLAVAKDRGRDHGVDR